jgi:hypothetical protein
VKNVSRWKLKRQRLQYNCGVVAVPVVAIQATAQLIAAEPEERVLTAGTAVDLTGGYGDRYCCATSSETATPAAAATVSYSGRHIGDYTAPATTLATVATILQRLGDAVATVPVIAATIVLLCQLLRQKQRQRQCGGNAMASTESAIRYCVGYKWRIHRQLLRWLRLQWRLSRRYGCGYSVGSNVDIRRRTIFKLSNIILFSCLYSFFSKSFSFLVG